MKKIIYTLFFGLLTFSFLACNNQGPQYSEKSNLLETTGTNEFAGKTVQNENTVFTFEENTVTQSKPSDSSENSKASAITNKIQDFYYDYNSENKTLDFQLKQVWGTAIATDYEAQLALATKNYKAAIATVKTAINNSTYVPTNETLNAKVQTQVLASSEKWINEQETLLNDYLKNKYDSVIHFEYELSDTKLTLSEKFKNDLSDASSKFVYVAEEYSVVLNDYDHLIPFMIQKGEDIYVGIPNFSDAKAMTGTVEVLLYPYTGDIYDTATITNIVAKVCVMPTDLTVLASIATELATSETSKTLQEFIDEQIGQQTLKASFTNSNGILTLTFTEVPNAISDVVNANDSIKLNYTPLLGATFDIAE